MFKPPKFKEAAINYMGRKATSTVFFAQLDITFYTGFRLILPYGNGMGMCFSIDFFNRGIVKP